MQTIHVAPHIAQLSNSQRENAAQLVHRNLVRTRGKRTQFTAWRILSRPNKTRSPEEVSRPERDRGLVRSS